MDDNQETPNSSNSEVLDNEGITPGGDGAATTEGSPPDRPLTANRTNDVEADSKEQSLPDSLKTYDDEELEDMCELFDGGTSQYKQVIRELARRKNEPPTPPGVSPLWDFKEPEPMEWTIEGLVPEGHLSMLVGDGGMGKSFLALYAALCVAAGRPFLKHGVKRGRVLYVDQELDEDEQKRRTCRVAEGMGMSVYSDALHKQLYYYQPDHGLGTDEHQQKMLDIDRCLDIDLVLYDSFTMGAAVDVKDDSDVVPITQQIRKWPTTLAIDHVSHSTAMNQRAASARAFGTVMKRNAARSSLTLVKADTGGYAIQQEKSNFNAGDGRLCYATEFTDEAVTFERIDEADERAAGLLADMSSKDVTLTAVKDQYEALGGAVLPDNVREWRDERDACKNLQLGTIRNHFTALKNRGELVDADGEGVLPENAGDEAR